MRAFPCLSLGLTLLFSASALAQQPQPQAEPEIRIRAYTKLVQVPVVVTDGGGRPIKDLKKEDFTLLENGKPVPIEIFEAVTAEDTAQSVAAAKIAAAKAAPGVYSNFKEGKPEHRAIVILVLDAINTPFFEQAQHRRELIKFLSDKVESGTLLSLLVMGRSGLRSIHEYTTDPNVLIAALKKAKGTVGAPGQAEIDASAKMQMPVISDALDAAKAQEEAAKLIALFNNQDEFTALQVGASFGLTMNGLRAIAQTYAGVPGRKALIWTAASFPHWQDDPRKLLSSDLSAMYMRVMGEVADAGIAIYPIDARGLVEYREQPILAARDPGRATRGTPSRDPGVLGGMGDTDLGRVGDNANVQDRMKELAENTGGVPYYGTNDLAGAIRKAATDSGSYYMLGYYLRGGEQVQVDRRVLKVQVKRSGVKVRSRQRAYLTAQNTDPKREIIMAQMSPLEFTNLPLQVKFDPKQKTDGAVPFEIQITPGGIELQGAENLVSVDVIAVARTPDGQIVDMVNQRMSGKISDVKEFRERPLAYNNKLRLPQGAATVRFIVRDNNSGKMGSVIVETP